MSDYERVARMIRLLDARRPGRVGLAELAAAAGLSPSHFHRLFSRWAGVSPRAFLAALAFRDARERLRMGESALAAALGAGLSSPGRLHDLAIAMEAATPGEIGSGGSGLVLRAGIAGTPFGPACLAESPRGICHLSFLETGARGEALARLAEDWPAASVSWDRALAGRLAAAIFARDPAAAAAPEPREPLRVFVRATPFRLKVWRALLAIPPGAAVSYGALAAACGHPGASRATGGAVGANPVAYLIPCHRVIRETGVVGGYRWSGERKRALLAAEAARNPLRPA